MKIAVLGGTFNPIHYAHLIIAEEVRDRLSMDKVLFIPTYIPPHKDVKPEEKIKEEHRVNMVKIAIKDNPFFDIDLYEIEQKGVSYTHKTLKHLYQKYETEKKILFIIGADLIPELYKWKNFDELIELCSFVALERGDIQPKYYTDQYPFLLILDNDISMDVSSTGIRKRVRENRSVRYLLPNKDVESYLIEHKLYKV
jgi:nicotinate-nucleotide adenylyltransferase